MTNTNQRRDNGAPVYQLEHVVDNIFNNSLRRFFDNNLWEAESPFTRGNVPVNIRETDHQYEVDVIAPGCHKEDFRILVENAQLIISFSRSDQKEESSDKAGWVRNEYLQRSFSRTFTLDETVDGNNISASYKDGILRVLLPKKETAKKLSKMIDVR